MMAVHLDYCVIGGGIVGMATAMSLLQRRPGVSLVVLEKEAELARHQTGHNSGVIHSGIYYAPGSLKAELCKKGAQATKDFCREHRIPVTVQGKLLVATGPEDAKRMPTSRSAPDATASRPFACPAPNSANRSPA